MNKNIKQLWVEALRSGQYKQTTGALRDSSGFCCLGVLCDLHSKESGEFWEFDLLTDPSYSGQKAHLPRNVVNWAGFERTMSDGSIDHFGMSVPIKFRIRKENLIKDTLDAAYLLSKGIYPFDRIDLALLNDYKVPFSKIADLIESRL